MTVYFNWYGKKKFLSFIETIVKSIPAKRLGKPEEIANTIKYLIDTEYVNGSTIKITGGL